MTDDLRELLSAIHVAEWPQRKCRLPIVVTRADTVPRDGSCVIFEDHLGPCADPGLGETIRQRAAWEKEHPGQAAKTGGSGFGDPYA